MTPSQMLVCYHQIHSYKSCSFIIANV